MLKITLKNILQQSKIMFVGMCVHARVSVVNVWVDDVYSNLIYCYMKNEIE